jgi:hypothetical protein
MKRTLAFALVSAATLAVVPAMAEEATATAAATPPPAVAEKGGDKEFGNPGTINFAAATALNFTTTSHKPPQGDSSSSMHIGISPSIDYFVAEGISVGGILVFDMQSDKAAGASDASKMTTIGLGPRVGYNLWLTPGSLSLWPKLNFLYETFSTSAGGNDGPSGNKMAVQIDVPLIIHPVKHFHIGIGPFIRLDLASKQKTPPSSDSTDGIKDTVIGLQGEIAGWL